jgi:CheY-like chemotaxis protein/anti-sigma regulatory factor (Ser/Thr protein kinase)
MPIILVVDDSETERRLIGGLVQQDLDWLIEYADNGQTALEMIEHATPDVVITDLMMPKMDGMQLVKKAKTKFPQVPFILVTGAGSEAIAAEALRAGAASYVPKSAMADALLDTVQQVLGLANRDHGDGAIVKCMTNARYQLRLENDPRLIPPLLEFVRQMLVRMHVGDSTAQRHVCVAIEEAVLNAMLHGNLALSAEEAAAVRRLCHQGKTSDLVERRRNEPGFRDRRVLFGMDLTPQRAQFVVRDAGSGFNVEALPPSADGAVLSKSGGRGLNLIRSFMSDVGFSETGNEIRMTLNG